MTKLNSRRYQNLRDIEHDVIRKIKVVDAVSIATMDRIPAAHSVGRATLACDHGCCGGVCVLDKAKCDI
jgi:hypothetical protein